MGFNCGIVGLPNVGKSTLFNALTSTVAAQAANYPFCTIEPNVGRVAVPDRRLDMLTQIGKSQKTVPTKQVTTLTTTPTTRTTIVRRAGTGTMAKACGTCTRSS